MIFDSLIPYGFCPVQNRTPIKHFREPKRFIFFVEVVFTPGFIGFTKVFYKFLLTFMARVDPFNVLPSSCNEKVIGNWYVPKSLDQNKRQGHQKVYYAAKDSHCCFMIS